MTQIDQDILRVAARMTVAGVGDFVNVFHYRQNDATPTPDQDTLDDMSKVVSAMYGNISGLLSSNLNFVDINVFNQTQNRPLGSTNWTTLTVGGAGGDMLPSQTAAFVRGLTGFSRNWAKKFIGGWHETQNTGDGFVAGTAITALTNWGAQWLVPGGAPVTTYEPVVFHLLTNQYRTIVSVELTNVWATVRRRRAGRGS